MNDVRRCKATSESNLNMGFLASGFFAGKGVSAARLESFFFHPLVFRIDESSDCTILEYLIAVRVELTIPIGR